MMREIRDVLPTPSPPMNKILKEEDDDDEELEELEELEEEDGADTAEDPLMVLSK